MPDETPQAEARKALGAYLKETVLYGRFTPPHDGLPVVNFAFVPLTPNEIEEAEQQRQRGKQSGIRQSVKLCADRLRKWDLCYESGDVVNCRDAAELGSHVDPTIINEVAVYILEARRCEEAREALSDFPGK